MGGGFKDTVGLESWYTEAITTVQSIYGSKSVHYQRIINSFNERHMQALEQAEGLIVGTKANIEGGFLDDLRTLVLLDIKGDFLDSARKLLDEGQKDPAAVLATIVLEDSLKRLAGRSGMGDAQGKEMGLVAALLLRESVIEKSTNQSIQSFKNLRNAALHAQWHEVSGESVSLLLAFLPMFIEKHGI